MSALMFLSANVASKIQVVVEFLFVVYWWKELLWNVVLPVTQHSVALLLLVFQVYILYVHSCVIWEISEGNFCKLLRKQILCSVVLGLVSLFVVHGHLSPHVKSRSRVSRRLLSCSGFGRESHSRAITWQFIPFIDRINRLNSLVFI